MRLKNENCLKFVEKLAILTSYIVHPVDQPYISSFFVNIIFLFTFISVLGTKNAELFEVGPCKVVKSV